MESSFKLIYNLNLYFIIITPTAYIKNIAIIISNINSC